MLGRNLVLQGYDATERSVAREALQRSELRLREGMKVAGMVVWDWELGTGHVTFSDNAPELFGAAWNNLPDVWQAMVPEDLSRLEAERLAAIACNGSYGDIVRLVRPDNGQLIWLQVRGTVVADADGRPICIRGVSIDVSACKRAEESLREASRHKDEFLAMLSHELRNPLAPIRSAAHLPGRAPDNVARVKQSSIIIERQVNHMTSLINDLLDVSRVNTGLVTLDKQVIDIHQVVVESIEQTPPLLTDRNHLLRVHAPAEGLVSVLGDRKRLVQVCHGGQRRAGGGCDILGLPAAHQQRECAGGPDAPGAALRLMVVDDNRDAAHAMAMLLELEGHTVAVEHEPQRALEKAAEFCPDACLLDIGLPGMDGYELARRLRSGEQTSAATLIALTGYGNKYGRETSVSAGFDFYFVKPAKTTELIAVLSGIQPAQLLGQRASGAVVF